MAAGPPSWNTLTRMPASTKKTGTNSSIVSACTPSTNGRSVRGAWLRRTPTTKAPSNTCKPRNCVSAAASKASTSESHRCPWMTPGMSATRRMAQNVRRRPTVIMIRKNPTA